MAVATVREPVPVFIFFRYEKPYSLSICCLSFLPVREPVSVYNFFQYGKPYSLSISTRTRFPFLPVRETIFAPNPNPNPNPNLNPNPNPNPNHNPNLKVPVREEMKNGYEKILRGDMVSCLGRN